MTCILQSDNGKEFRNESPVGGKVSALNIKFVIFNSTTFEVGENVDRAYH